MSLGLDLDDGSRAVSIITDHQADLISITFDCDGETYQWIGKATELDLILREIGKDAANPQLAITWSDAAFIKQILRSQFPSGIIASKFYRFVEKIKKYFS